MLYFHSCFFQTKILLATTTMEHEIEFEIWNSMLQVVKHSYSCALERSFLYHGRMYVSPLHICFHSNIFGKQLKVSSPQHKKFPCNVKVLRVNCKKEKDDSNHEQFLWFLLKLFWWVVLRHGRSWIEHVLLFVSSEGRDLFSLRQESLTFIQKTTRALFRLAHFPLLLMVSVALLWVGGESAGHLALWRHWRG